MKIGSFIPLQSNPGKQPGQTFSLPNTDNHESSTQRSTDQSSNSLPQALFQAIDSAETLHEFIAAAEQHASMEAEVFNLDRDFSRSTQDALSAYVTTEGYQSVSQGELVGVDLYV